MEDNKLSISDKRELTIGFVIVGLVYLIILIIGIRFFLHIKEPNYGYRVIDIDKVSKMDEFNKRQADVAYFPPLTPHPAQKDIRRTLAWIPLAIARKSHK